MKRGAGIKHVPFEDVIVLNGDRNPDLVALDDASNALERVDPRKVQVVEMRYFGGLSMEETAAVLNVSPATVRRDWSAARIWLYRELTGRADNGLGALEASR